MTSQASAAIGCVPGDYGFLQFVSENPLFCFLCLCVICSCVASTAKHLRGNKL